MFLPAAGNRNGTTVNNTGSNGNYWSSTQNDSDNAYKLNFNTANLNPQNNNNRNNGFSVRLVQVLSTDECIIFLTTNSPPMCNKRIRMPNGTKAANPT